MTITQPFLWHIGKSSDIWQEDPDYLSQQLITYIGNKRALLPFIQQAIEVVKKRLGKDKLRILDAFAGSGVVSRFFKQYASYLISNDLETYAATIGSCYLANASEVDTPRLRELHEHVIRSAESADVPSGIISRLYAPKDCKNILPGERVFYSPANARSIDVLRQIIGEIPPRDRPFFLAPLLSEASIHANTSGVFKGFYKNTATGIGQFGGNNQDALTRILGDIRLPFPIFSRFETDWVMHQQDANKLVRQLADLDLAYFDPPYNQHPYGSNYFMLNVIAEYREPEQLSKVSGIPKQWNRSNYNKRQEVFRSLQDLVTHTDARYILMSYNDEGFVTGTQMHQLLSQFGKVVTFAKDYNTFRGSRNLRDRSVRVTEQLFLVEKT